MLPSSPHTQQSEAAVVAAGGETGHSSTPRCSCRTPRIGTPAMPSDHHTIPSYDAMLVLETAHPRWAAEPNALLSHEQRRKCTAALVVEPAVAIFLFIFPEHSPPSAPSPRLTCAGSLPNNYSSSQNVLFELHESTYSWIFG